MHYNHSFCPIPWVSLEIKNNGDYRMCPESASHFPSRGLITNSSGDIQNIKIMSVTDARNSSLLQEVRKNMVAGCRSEHCERCNHEDDNGHLSHRKIAKVQYEKFITSVNCSSLTSSDGSIDTARSPLRELTLRLGNTCNLQCRMCGPSESNSWYADWMALGYTGFNNNSTKLKLVAASNKVVVSEVDPFNWFATPELVEKIKKEFSNLTTLYLTGGEPFVMKQHYNLLNFLINNKLSHQISLIYNTNLTVIPKHLFKAWDEFKSVEIGCSIDGTKEINEYIRHPSKWGVITKNLRALDQYASHNSKVDVYITFTWQILNAFVIPDLISWVLTQKFKNINRLAKSPAFSFHAVRNPQYHNVTNLPHKTKELLVQQLTDWINDWLIPYAKTNQMPESAITQIINMINSMQQYLFSAEPSSKLLEEFMTQTNALDMVRKQDFRQLNNTLYTHITDYLCSLR